MTTANDIVNRSLRSINVLGESETPSAAASLLGFDSLNELLGQWSNESLMIYQTVTESFPFVSGQYSYTLGPGGNFNTVRPMSIDGAYVKFNGVDYPVGMVALDEYNDIMLKTSTSNIPFVMVLNSGFPLSTLLFWPAPNDASASIYIDSSKPLTEFATPSTVVSLPPGYERALRLNLAVELMPSYGANVPLILQQAANAKTAIKRTNYIPITLDLPDGIPTGPGYQDWRY